ADELIDERDRQHDVADGHRKLRNPERCRIVAGRYVVKRMRLPRKAQAEPGERHRQYHRDRERPPFEPSLAVGARMLEAPRPPDVLTTGERVREREKAGAGHEVAGIGVGSAQLEVWVSSANSY